MRTDTSRIVVEQLAEADVAAARELIVACLAERWNRYEARFNLDLETFPAAYAGSVILVAKVDGVLLGTGILKPCVRGSAEIVRMSVSADHRRCGVGSRILDALLREACRRGCRRVILETTRTWTDAVAFYRARGFMPTEVRDGNQYFVLIPGESNETTV